MNKKSIWHKCNYPFMLRCVCLVVCGCVFHCTLTSTLIHLHVELCSNIFCKHCVRRVFSLFYKTDYSFCWSTYQMAVGWMSMFNCYFVPLDKLRWMIWKCIVCNSWTKWLNPNLLIEWKEMSNERPLMLCLCA